MTGEHRLLDAARDGGQGAFARLVGPYLAQPRACSHRMLRPPFRAGHGAMDLGACPDQYHHSNRSIRRAAAARLSQRKTSVAA
jgi:hypothetical protein